MQRPNLRLIGLGGLTLATGIAASMAAQPQNLPGSLTRETDQGSKADSGRSSFRCSSRTGRARAVGPGAARVVITTYRKGRSIARLRNIPLPSPFYRRIIMG